MKIRKIMASICLAIMMGTSAVFAGDSHVDVNTATVEQLQTVNGIGKKTAAEIVAYREAHGPFKSVDALVHVKGIGEKKLEQIRGSVEVGGDANSAN
ncbi:ComEA family DNA-binding protein [Mariprofundus ferrooxydans]|uniref:Late competence protein required for DNA binding and uptake n=1 Tax=Mariprofundus ferrooxydans PV-1 TaxID=314345 RepID=Q0EYL1_9PROT|nr:helix-hairpin-helix domain-containing protein [Mariprofundus ferrooxydans]EAU54356.1 late competence protein required for DNA binding and uptake [Mariprofundus ferrooxydans PV-1]KON47420.1 competence protein ComEA [Mariprofundus ferrooxydans]